MIPLILHRILMGGYREKSMFELKIDNSDKEILVSPQLLCKFGLVSSVSIIFSKRFFSSISCKGIYPISTPSLRIIT
jgi:hypothetical protein